MSKTKSGTTRLKTAVPHSLSSNVMTSCSNRSMCSFVLILLKNALFRRLTIYPVIIKSSIWLSHDSFHMTLTWLDSFHRDTQFKYLIWWKFTETYIYYMVEEYQEYWTLWHCYTSAARRDWTLTFFWIRESILWDLWTWS